MYNSIVKYFTTLSVLGYYSYKEVSRLLVLIFHYNLMYNDYRGYISKEDYKTIGKALNSLYGTNCLIPYPDYLKMGKLRLGEITELASRTKNLESYSKELDQRILDNDVLIADNIRRLDEHGTRLDEHDSHLSMHDERIGVLGRRLDGHDVTITNHEGRIAAIESTKVVKSKDLLRTIPEIDYP